MNDLKNYVDKLFKKYKDDDKIKDLKLEILSNLESKKCDLMKNGMNEKNAIIEAENNITNIDYLIDDNINVYFKKLKLEFLQQVLLYSVIVWIITIPLTIFRQFLILNFMFVVFIVILGVNYIYKYKNTDENYLLKNKYVNRKFYNKLKNICWVI